MPIDFTVLEPEGLQIHIKLNSLLSEYGFFKNITPAQKREFDLAFEKIVSAYLPYDDDQ
jgi:hypothetical protein